MWTASLIHMRFFGLKHRPPVVGLVQLIALPALAFESARTTAHIWQDHETCTWIDLFILVAAAFAIAFTIGDLLERTKKLLKRRVLIALFGLLAVLSWVAYFALVSCCLYWAPYFLPVLYSVVFGAMIPQWLTERYGKLVDDAPLPLFTWADEQEAKAKKRREQREWEEAQQHLEYLRRHDPGAYMDLTLPARARMC